jgi:hypothetical protein
MQLGSSIDSFPCFTRLNPCVAHCSIDSIPLGSPLEGRRVPWLWLGICPLANPYELWYDNLPSTAMTTTVLHHRHHNDSFFFDTPLFVLFASDTFILPVMSVFTRIPSRAAGEGGLRRQHWSRSNLLHGGDGNNSKGGRLFRSNRKDCVDG